MKWHTLTAEMVAMYETPPFTLWGITLMNYEFDCRCRTCCTNGIDDEDIWWYPDVSLSVWFDIYIRTDKEIPIRFERNVITREGIYGHEQLHVLNFIDAFNTNFLPNISANVLQAQKWHKWKKGPTGKQECQLTCARLERLIQVTKSVLAREAGHKDQDTRDPRQGHWYPPIGNMPNHPAM